MRYMVFFLCCLGCQTLPSYKPPSTSVIRLQYNFYEDKWEFNYLDSTFKFNIYENRWEYNPSYSTLKFNIYENRWEFVP